MRAWERDTVGSASTSVLPGARPIVIASGTGTRVPSSRTSSYPGAAPRASWASAVDVDMLTLAMHPTAADRSEQQATPLARAGTAIDRRRLSGERAAVLSGPATRGSVVESVSRHRAPGGAHD